MCSQISNFTEGSLYGQRSSGIMTGEGQSLLTDQTDR